LEIREWYEAAHDHYEFFVNININVNIYDTHRDMQDARVVGVSRCYHDHDHHSLTDNYHHSYHHI
jgi:hypothetical protein